LVSLLSARPTWTCRELADRTGVTERTVRRDIAKLRELGYGVESDAGPWGGYRLAPGTRMPPLILDDEEALAVSIALREAALSGVLGGDQTALSALLKLRQAMPTRVADRLSAMDATFVHSSRPGEQQIAPATLLNLATACRRSERIRLSYRDHAGKATVRDVDPYRLVRTGRRWYFVAMDVASGEWRTFRADRVVQAQPTGRLVEIPDPPDPALLVSRSIASVVYPLYVRIRLPLPMEKAIHLVPPTIGTHTHDGPDATVIDIGGNTPEQLAVYLLGLGTPLRVLSPDDVREALQHRARELFEHNR
jgi:predicted DNA-binding transcriptional regulator YafY